MKRANLSQLVINLSPTKDGKIEYYITDENKYTVVSGRSSSVYFAIKDAARAYWRQHDLRKPE